MNLFRDFFKITLGKRKDPWGNYRWSLELGAPLAVSIGVLAILVALAIIVT